MTDGGSQAGNLALVFGLLATISNLTRDWEFLFLSSFTY